MAKKVVSTNLKDFQKTFGIGLIGLKGLSIQQGANPFSYNLVLKKKSSLKAIKVLQSDRCHGKALRENLKKKLHFLWKIKTYKGIRHMLRLPGRGQRTHTNAKTKKKFKSF